MKTLARSHRIIRFELPVATTRNLADLVLALADRLGIERFAYAGIAGGGAVGTWLAVHHPERIASLTLICPSARIDEPDMWSDFSRITAPTLIVAGRENRVTPIADVRALADRIPGASLTEIAHATHLAMVERPSAVLAALLDHLDANSEAGGPKPIVSDDASRHTTGLATRRAVLGDAHVDRAISRTTEFTAVFQDFITRYAWGEIWTRPGLSRTTRRCITLTAMIANGQHDEFAMHVRAAVRDGLTPGDIQEVLLQSAIYCGVPAANIAFAIADRILREEGHEDQPARS